MNLFLGTLTSVAVRGGLFVAGAYFAYFLAGWEGMLLLCLGAILRDVERKLRPGSVL